MPGTAAGMTRNIPYNAGGGPRHVAGTRYHNRRQRHVDIAAWLGAGPFSEAFFAMLQVINFFRRLLAEGALNGAFVPIWLTLRSAEDGEANANRFTWRSLLAMLCVTGVIA